MRFYSEAHPWVYGWNSDENFRRHCAALTAIIAPTNAETVVQQSDLLICANALNREKSGWDSNSPEHVREANRRGLTLDVCRQLIAHISPGISEPPASVDYGTREQREFLEAAAFFLTGVDATSDEIVSNREIVLRQYPLVIYLVDNKPCTVRMRNPERQWVMQWDLCKITNYLWHQGGWVWEGEPDAFCASRWLPNENYVDPDFKKLGERVKCNQPAAMQGSWDAQYFATGEFRDYRVPWRSQERMMASFKYIVTLLTGKPY